MGVVDNYVRFTLRLPEELRDDLLKIAKQNHRSLNSEILVALQDMRDSRQEDERSDKVK